MIIPLVKMIRGYTISIITFVFNSLNESFMKIHLFYKEVIVILKVLLISIFFSFSIQAVTINDFSRHPEFYDVKISPDGKYLATLVNTEGRKTLAFLDSDTFKVIFALGGDKRDQVADYYWVNNERVIVQVEQVRGSLEDRKSVV